MSSKKSTLRGFTLVEILVVVALIAILAAVTIIAINPAKNFADTRDATRSADVTQILNAVTQYTSEEGNSLSTLETAIGATVNDCDDVAGPSAIGTDDVDLDQEPLVDEYIVGIPLDPSGGTAADTGYTICETGTGRIEVAAPSAENRTISVRR